MQNIIPERFSFIRWFDGHLHFREGSLFSQILKFIAASYYGGVAMGNLFRLIETSQQHLEYRDRFAAEAPDFKVVTTIMLTYNTTPESLEKAYYDLQREYPGAKMALKLIPGTTSTNSKGVELWDFWKFYPVLKKAGELGIPALIHLELEMDPKTGRKIPDIEREIMALPYGFDAVNQNPQTTIIFEHASTIGLMELLKQALPLGKVFGTCTFHHQSKFSYEDVFWRDGRIKNPHLFCRPILKTKDDASCVREAVANGQKNLYMGSDLAMHPIAKKENPEPGKKPAAGIANLFNGLMQFQLFAKAGKTENFQSFASERGPRVFGLEPSKDTITLIQKDFQIPREYAGVKIFCGGETIHWQTEEG